MPEMNIEFRFAGPDARAEAQALADFFRQADTASRLLLTSRYEFTLREGAEDLAQQLFPLDLVPMRDYESRKQAAAKQRAQQTPLWPARQESLHRRLPEILDSARGNPSLQDLLFSLALQDDRACDRCLQQMQQYLRTGQLPAEQQVLKFLEDLAVGTLLALLTLGQPRVSDARMVCKSWPARGTASCSSAKRNWLARPRR
ncbi:MAG: hypothetical protein NTY19_07310 [Planctomycetota bacterium]|nr:hypothetical protein [Planctomycetota bacterium]